MFINEFRKNHGYNVQYSNYIYLYLAEKLFILIKKTNITPNQLTILSFSLGVISAFFFALGQWTFLFLAIISIHLSIVVDFLDGIVARRKGETSVFGAWIDSIVDRTVDPLIFIGISYGIYNQTQDGLVWLLCTLAVTARLFVDILFFITKMEIPNGKNFMQCEVNKGWFVRTFLYGRSNIHFITTIFVIINQMYLYLIAIILYSLSFYLYSFFYLSKKIRHM